MATIITVRYSKPGTQPPVYLAGSFTEPPWRIQEMEHTPLGNNQYDFHKDVEVEAGKEYQYKLRVGESDWWILNEDAPTVTDNIGNRNNLLKVPPRKESENTDSKMAASESIPTSEIAESFKQHADKRSEATTVPSNGQGLATEKAVSQSLDGATTNTGAGEVNKLPGEGSSEFTKAEHTPHVTKDTSGETSPSETDDGYVKVRRMSEVAAEVADVARGLDRDQPTPPISDEEAGHIGYRRMSSTPIPEVANTAAEVADSAALLDKEHLPKLEMPETFDPGYDSGDETPFHERAPLFAHECLEPPSADNDYHFPQQTTPPAVQSEHEAVDFNDPLLEEFPCDRRLILETVRSLETSLNEDPTSVEGVPPSPVVGSETNNHQPEHLELPSPPANLAVLERSPSLNSIAEEDGEDGITSSPSAVNLNQAASVPEPVVGPTVDVREVKPETPKAVEETETPVTPFVVGKQLGDEPQQIPTSDDTPDLLVTPATPGAGLKDSSDPFGSASSAEHSESQSAAVDTASSSEHPESQSAAVDTASSSAIEQLNSVKSRKPPAAVDRPNTQNSVRSTGDDAKNRNFLRAFWRVVFVDWIGGIIMRLCGRRRTVMAVSAVTFMVVAPAVYYVAGW